MLAIFLMSMLALATNPKWVMFAQLQNKTEYEHTDTGNYTHEQHRIAPRASVQDCIPNSHSLALRMRSHFPANPSPPSGLEDDDVTVPVPVSVSRTTENAPNPAARRDTALGFTSSTDAPYANAPSPAPPRSRTAGIQLGNFGAGLRDIQRCWLREKKKLCVG